MKKRFTSIGVLCILFSQYLFAQVSDLSYTLSPTGEYIFWNDKAGLSDGFLAGGKLGLGFGQNVELSAIYLRSLDLKTDFSDFGIEGFDESLIASRDVLLERLGGELKLNLSQGNLLPFLTVGSGIQKSELTLESGPGTLNEQIYLDLGAGIVLSVDDRYTLSFSAKNSQYRYHPIRDLMTVSDRQDLGIDVDDYTSERLGNWGINAALQFYIGGRSPKAMSEVDKAYYQTFGNGLRGVSIPIEPVAGKINFHENLPYRDTWYAGISGGINIGDYIGLRGFYWQALEEGGAKSFDDLSLYGGEAKFNLNRGRGMIPYISLGGGYLDVKDEYVGRNEVTSLNDQPFAMGGAGLTLPLSPYFKVFGGARAVLMSSEDLDDLSQPTDVIASWNYNFGLRLVIGRKAKDPNEIIERNLNQRLDTQQEEYVSAQQQLEMEYQNKMSRMEKEYKKKDSLELARSQRKLDSLSRLVDSLGRVNKDSVSNEKNVQEVKSEVGEIELSPEEFGKLIEKMMDYRIEMKKLDIEAKRVEAGGQVEPQAIREIDGREVDSIHITKSKEIKTADGSTDSLAVMISRKEFQKYLDYKSELRDASNSEDAHELEEYNRQVSELNREISDQQEQIRELNNNLNNREAELTKLKEMEDPAQEFQGRDSLLKTKGPDSSFLGRLYYDGLSVIGGGTFGEGNGLVLGVRGNYRLRNTGLRFFHENYFLLGSESRLGLSVNAVYDIFSGSGSEIAGSFRPYAGLGFGIQGKNDTGVLGTFNIVVGSELNLWEGKAFVDFTTRNLLDYNQVVLGYRLPI